MHAVYKQVYDENFNDLRQSVKFVKLKSSFSKFTVLYLAEKVMYIPYMSVYS